MLRFAIFLAFLAISRGQNRPHAPQSQNLRECEPCDIEACRTPAAIECLAGNVR